MSAVPGEAPNRRRAPRRAWTALTALLAGAAIPGATDVMAQQDTVTAALPAAVDRLDHAAMLSPFRLTKDDIAQLALPGGAPLWGIESEGTESTALNALIARLGSGLTESTLGLLDARFADSASAMAAIDTVLGPAIGLDSTVVPVDMDAALRPVQRDTTPQMVRDSLRARLRSYPPLEGDQGPPLAEAALEKLPTLVDLWFPDGYMFRTALRLVLADTVAVTSPRGVRRILAVSREPEGPSPDSVFLQPLAWTGAGCGCGVYAEGDVWEPEFYGIYPYWEASQTEEALVPKDTIDLSMFTRVGYYGVTFDTNGRIRDPRHWKTGKYPPSAWPFRGRDFSDFSKEAHTHKVNVDLVVYKDDWSWLPESLDGSGGDDARAVFDELSREMLGLISQPLGNFMDRMKPWVSLGQSPRRTLGDGITLDFDFSGIEAPERQTELFDYLRSIKFFKALHDTLMTRANDGYGILHMDLDYRLNLIVPLECLVVDPDMGPANGCGFYSVENLDSLRTDGVDLFLVDMTAVSAGSALAGDSIDVRTRKLRSALDVLSAEDQLALVTRVIPLALTSPGDPMKDFVRISDMSFRGVGGWSARSMGAINESLEEIFLRPPPRGRLATAFASFETRVCDLMCPARWWIRLLIWVVGIAYVAFWFWTESHYDWKQVYRTRAHSALVVIFCLTLVATLWCDPYWKSRQTLIVSVLAAGGLVAFLLIQRRMRLERDYP